MSTRIKVDTLGRYLNKYGIKAERPPSPEPVKVTRFNEYKSLISRSVSLTPDDEIHGIWPQETQRSRSPAVKQTTSSTPPPEPRRENSDDKSLSLPSVTSQPVTVISSRLQVLGEWSVIGALTAVVGWAFLNFTDIRSLNTVVNDYLFSGEGLIQDRLENVNDYTAVNELIGDLVNASIILGSLALFRDQIITYGTALCQKMNVLSAQSVKIFLVVMVFAVSAAYYSGYNVLFYLYDVLVRPMGRTIGDWMFSVVSENIIQEYKFVKEGIDTDKFCSAQTFTDKDASPLKKFINAIQLNSTEYSETQQTAFNFFVNFASRLVQTTNGTTTLWDATFATGAEGATNFFVKTQMGDSSTQLLDWSKNLTATFNQGFPSGEMTGTTVRTLLPKTDNFCTVNESYLSIRTVMVMFQVFKELSVLVAAKFTMNLTQSIFSTWFQGIYGMYDACKQKTLAKLPQKVQVLVGYAGTFMAWVVKTFFSWVILPGWIAQQLMSLASTETFTTVLSTIKNYTLTDDNIEVLRNQGVLLAKTIDERSTVLFNDQNAPEIIFGKGITWGIIGAVNLFMLFGYVMTYQSSAKTYHDRVLTSSRMRVNVTSARLIKRFKVAPTSCVRAPLLASL